MQINGYLLSKVINISNYILDIITTVNSSCEIQNSFCTETKS